RKSVHPGSSGTGSAGPLRCNPCRLCAAPPDLEFARTTGVLQRIQDLGEQRIADMDCSGVDLQILSLSCPGVQIFDGPTATALARASNDQLAEAIRKYPQRLAGLAAVAPQEPAAAARELARGVRELG